MNEESEQIWLEDTSSTWLIRRKDLLKEMKWEGVSDPRFTGRPVLLLVKEGAEIFQIRRFTVQLLSEPVTLTNMAHGAPLTVDPNGTIRVAGQGDFPLTEIGIRPGTTLVPTSGSSQTKQIDYITTVSCWTTNWGMTFQGDDCG